MVDTETIEMEKLDHTAYSLALMADCASPDAPDSLGAKMLLSVQDGVNEWIEYQDDVGWHKSDEWSDAIHEIADNAPDIYTYQRWQEFVDLGAYLEDPELGEWSDDLTEAAGVALYQIASRLASSLFEEAIERATDGN